MRRRNKRLRNVSTCEADFEVGVLVVEVLVVGALLARVLVVGVIVVGVVQTP